MLQMMLRYCLFMVSHYIFDALDVFLDLFFFRSILDGSQFLEKCVHTVHTLFMFEILSCFFCVFKMLKKAHLSVNLFRFAK